MKGRSMEPKYQVTKFQKTKKLILLLNGSNGRYLPTNQLSQQLGFSLVLRNFITLLNYLD